MIPELYIIRGIPGAGKSTFAKRMLEIGMADAHFEADMYFEKDGKYQFDASKLKQAHEWCQKQVKKALQEGKRVVVSNTFTRISEMQPYFDICKEIDKPFEVVRLTSNYGSIHNVPPESIAKMKARFQNYRGEVLIK